MNDVLAPSPCIYTSRATAETWAAVLWREWPRGYTDAATLVRALVAAYTHGLVARIVAGGEVDCVTAQWCIVSRVRAVARRAGEPVAVMLWEAAHAADGVIEANGAAQLAPLVKLLEDLAVTITPA